MSEWKDFLEGLPEDTALAIELTQALEIADRVIKGETVCDIEWRQFYDTLKHGQEFMSKYVR